MKKFFFVIANIIVLCSGCNSENDKARTKISEVKIGNKPEIEKEKKAREIRRKAFNKLSESLDSSKNK